MSGWAIDNEAAVGTPITSAQVLVDRSDVGNASYRDSQEPPTFQPAERPLFQSTALQAGGLIHGEIAFYLARHTTHHKDFVTDHRFHFSDGQQRGRDEFRGYSRALETEHPAILVRTNGH